jgi:hypothetical protein
LPRSYASAPWQSMRTWGADARQAPGGRVAASSWFTA